MISYEVHFLVHSLDTLHISSCVIGKLYLVATADAFCSPVEISHIYRTSDLACDSVETCLPALYRLACSFRCEGEVNHLLCLHLPDHAENYIAASLSVDRNSSELAEKPSERSPEKFSLDHTIRLSAH